MSDQVDNISDDEALEVAIIQLVTSAETIEQGIKIAKRAIRKIQREVLKNKLIIK